MARKQGYGRSRYLCLHMKRKDELDDYLALDLEDILDSWEWIFTLRLLKSVTQISFAGYYE